MVVDFSATWCVPCKVLESFLRSLASKYEDVEFINIDVDELKAHTRRRDALLDAVELGLDSLFKAQAFCYFFCSHTTVA
ncbi:hypothetical protein L6452_10238 [Arctium lappa]|uniref:Uncharacterized protein n=1 Tax=Arctium lappa TaxID=4217 RepID=A0ACB9DMJ1_ARCLA|nr:hypothetical protein L6452_10238 [Arctium lappa]